MHHAFLPRELPKELALLTDLALDLRWTWSHAGDELWKLLSPETWEKTKNPWLILQDVPRERLEQLADDPHFKQALQNLVAERTAYLNEPGWFSRQVGTGGLRRIAYFSMEFGLGEALPLYAGGLGILAGDYLKAASDLGVPVVGVGLLYQEGYFRQLLDDGGWQQEVYPYNDPTSLPVQPVIPDSGNWLHVQLQLPGRPLYLRVWKARVGRLDVYLLYSNDPNNSPADRGITSKLYGGGIELRFLQELVLGIGGWRMLEALGLEIDVCHLNEGHAAFVILERARRFMEQNQVSFWEAVWATRAGNVFTTHTPVAAGFDNFEHALIDKYFPYFRTFVAQLKLSLAEILAFGRKDPNNPWESFNMAYLAMRGCARANGVSRLHGEVSRHIFTPLFPRWPEKEVPLSHVTNGVHVPTWDSVSADKLWTQACGKERWRGAQENLCQAIQTVSDEELWSTADAERHELVHFARERLAKQFGQRGADPEAVAQAYQVLDANALTLGFARRFTEYKRPNLLLHDPERLTRLLTDPNRPVQIIIAGKAHPGDGAGKLLVKAWADFAGQAKLRNRAVFLEDYDMFVAQELVRVVDVWINTPRRPWEACGTIGMKVLVNGGLNLSELDGWWAEAYSPEVGWALGDDHNHTDPDWDAHEADQLYQLLEEQVIPEFFARDAQGIPRAWVGRMRASMGLLAPHFSSNRMVREYVTRFYVPAAADFQRRATGKGQLAKELTSWAQNLLTHWDQLHLGNLEVNVAGDSWSFTIQVFLGEMAPDWVRVELYADPHDDGEPLRQVMNRGHTIPGAINGYVYQAAVPATRPCSDFTPRIIPYHPDALVPMEATPILWQG
jgi:starch phosphorylase